MQVGCKRIMPCMQPKEGYSFVAWGLRNYDSVVDYILPCRDSCKLIFMLFLVNLLAEWKEILRLIVYFILVPFFFLPSARASAFSFPSNSQYLLQSKLFCFYLFFWGGILIYYKLFYSKSLRNNILKLRLFFVNHFKNILNVA